MAAKVLFHGLSGCKGAQPLTKARSLEISIMSQVSMHDKTKMIMTVIEAKFDLRIGKGCNLAHQGKC